jgi:outer membrane receptor protein involved in Fe transport
MGGRTNTLAAAVRLALSFAAAAVATSAPRVAAAQAADRSADAEGQVFETILVTGSNIRRVDTETANPIITIDRAAIDRSGKLTLGDLLQDLPAVTGPVQNPRVNRGGGGTGASTVSLRGLGTVRTLILVNGHRYLYGDVNAIPAAAVERIEVLTDGASAVYGSDAIGGVVNFILRSSYQGAEFAADYGLSDRDDGQRQGYHFVFGQATDKGNLLAGVDYNKFELILAGNRDFSKKALYYYYGAVHVALGRRTTPGGYIQLPPDLQERFGCPYVTLKALGVISHPPSLEDFRCFNRPTDGYNIEARGNVELTPQERTSAFVTGTYKLTNDIETYLEFFHNKTQSASIAAPFPIFTMGGPGLVISAQNYYNPFGVDFSNDAYSFTTRLVGNGDRFTDYSTQADQATAGFRGTFADSSWLWNAYFNYSHFKSLVHNTGVAKFDKLKQEFGPSYKDAAGNIVCGTDPAAGGTGPIAGCTPLDIFDVFDPATVAAFFGASGDTFLNAFYNERSGVAEINGDLWNLPAGVLKLAAGVSYRKQYGQTLPDGVLYPDEQGQCDSPSGCVAPIVGAYDVKEAYAELLLPLLKERPFASALNLTIGDRYSKYSNFGSTNNTKFAIEYRPVEDLLLRGTVSSVFRAPNISDLYQGYGAGFPGPIVDPCVGLVGTNAACVGVPGDGSFAPVIDQLTGRPAGVSAVLMGAVPAQSPIGPEYGKSFNWGFVYDPNWLPGLSFGADLWRVYLNNVIGPLSVSSILELCYRSNGGPYCHLIHRTAHGPSQGQLEYVVDPIGNLGRVDVKGTDLNAHYRLPATAFGRFEVNFLATYLDRYTNDLAPGLPGDLPQEYAGHFTNASGASAISGNFSRWKALASINWNLGAWSAAWTLKYIGRFTVGYARLDYGESACWFSYPPGCELKYGGTVYDNVSAGYDLEAVNTRIDVGIDNLTDKPPPILYANNAFGSNVDAATFDTIGRFYWARLTVKF